MAKQPTYTKPHLLIYKLKDNSIDFGARLFDTLRPLYASARDPPMTIDLVAKLTERFPNNTHLFTSEKDWGFYVLDNPFTSIKETLLIDCPDGLQGASANDLKYWGYQIFPEQNKLNVLRGYQCYRPNSLIRQALTDSEFNRCQGLCYLRAYGTEVRLFPSFHIDAYNLQELPTEDQFKDDMRDQIIS